MSFASHESSTQREKKVGWSTCLCSFFAERQYPCTQPAWIAAFICIANMWEENGEWRTLLAVISGFFLTSKKKNTKSTHRWGDAESASGVDARVMMFATFWCKRISPTLLWSVNHNSMIFYIKEYRFHTKPPALRTKGKVFYASKKIYQGFRRTDSCVFSKWSSHLLCSTGRGPK